MFLLLDIAFGDIFVSATNFNTIISLMSTFCNSSLTYSIAAFAFFQALLLKSDTEFFFSAIDFFRISIWDFSPHLSRSCIFPICFLLYVFTCCFIYLILYGPFAFSMFLRWYFIFLIIYSLADSLDLIFNIFFLIIFVLLSRQIANVVLLLEFNLFITGTDSHFRVPICV